MSELEFRLIWSKLNIPKYVGGTKQREGCDDRERLWDQVYMIFIHFFFVFFNSINLKKNTFHQVKDMSMQDLVKEVAKM